jgi:hypothetical protein
MYITLVSVGAVDPRVAYSHRGADARRGSNAETFGQSMTLKDMLGSVALEDSDG